MASNFVKTELESLMKLAECPICFEIPRDGVMLQCVNGHNVCAACKNKLDKDNKAKCPQGRCDYHNPPTINRTVAGLVERCAFPCKFSEAKDDNHSKCTFEGTDDMLKHHEIICEHRSVECLVCDDFVSADRFVGHLETAHGLPANGKGTNPDDVNTCFVFRQDHDTRSDNFGVISGVHETRAGIVLPCVKFQGDLMLVYLTMVAHSGVTEKLKCHLTLGNAEYSTNVLSRVYPVDQNWEEIIHDEDCARVSRWMIHDIFSDEVAEDAKSQGLTSKLEVSFKIVAN